MIIRREIVGISMNV